MTTPAALGIDPGKAGGIALVYDDGSAEAYPMPETERDILDLIGELRSRWETPAPLAVLEFVRSSPQMGVTSAFTFGMGYGGLRMALLAHGFRIVDVTPPKWQGALGCRTKGEKNVTKAKSQALFPSVKRVTHKTADALLLAEYGRRLG